MNKHIKDFDKWNAKKKLLEKRSGNDIFFRERDIWWCSLGTNLGSEEDGKNELFERPVLVIRKFGKESAWVLPITTKLRKQSPYHFIFEGENGASVDSAILSQIRTVSIKRFQRFMRRVSTYEFSMVIGRTFDLLSYR
jgi:mRNA-degrading endonuclease toxin of MazEF toxin-antitoxin module